METPSEFDNPTTNDATDSLIRVSGMYEIGFWIMLLMLFLSVQFQPLKTV